MREPHRHRRHGMRCRRCLICAGVEGLWKWAGRGARPAPGRSPVRQGHCRQQPADLQRHSQRRTGPNTSSTHRPERPAPSWPLTTSSHERSPQLRCLHGRSGSGPADRLSGVQRPRHRPRAGRDDPTTSTGRTDGKAGESPARMRSAPTGPASGRRSTRMSSPSGSQH